MKTNRYNDSSRNQILTNPLSVIFIYINFFFFDPILFRGFFFFFKNHTKPMINEEAHNLSTRSPNYRRIFGLLLLLFSYPSYGYHNSGPSIMVIHKSSSYTPPPPLPRPISHPINPIIQCTMRPSSLCRAYP